MAKKWMAVKLKLNWQGAIQEKDPVIEDMEGVIVVIIEETETDIEMITEEIEGDLLVHVLEIDY